ncbi:Internalin-A precursor [Enhygromyxa salina]|uniref:Internalin-A n=1 Tax=Enhygromyxa salina TaxID=215803 RepID=A0A2S9YK28_9BACT|nr:leucine-rich repeat domain-containing protein [Enhygromyxa salina]PRQ05451.1 Internalin-A precursor [Enhygromyxa salina]
MGRPELEAALRRDPHDEHAWAVFGDLLAAEGDIRGELIALDQRAAASEKPFERSVLEHRAAELAERERRRWLGPLADAGLEITWMRGFAINAVIARHHPSTLAALLELPTAALLRELVLVRPRGLASIAKHLRDRAIETLTLRAPHCDSLEDLAALEQLRELVVDGGSTTGVEALASLPRLERLSLRRCRGEVVGLAAGFTGLRSLELSARADVGELGDGALAPLAHLTELRELSLRDGGWSELDALADLRALEQLDLRSTDISSLAPLAELAALRELDLSGCTDVTDLEPLARLHALERLELGYTRVRRLQPLAGLRRLEVIELAGTSVADLSPLFELPALRKVGVEACEIDDLQPLRARGVTLTGARAPEPSWRELAEGLLRSTKS